MVQHIALNPAGWPTSTSPRRPPAPAQARPALLRRPIHGRPRSRPPRSFTSRQPSNSVHLNHNPTRRVRTKRRALHKPQRDPSHRRARTAASAPCKAVHQQLPTTDSRRSPKGNSKRTPSPSSRSACNADAHTEPLDTRFERQSLYTRTSSSAMRGRLPPGFRVR
jgi:hypothetical protein